VDWIRLVQGKDRSLVLLNTVMNHLELQKRSGIYCCSGVEGVVRGLEGIYLADRCTSILTKLEKCRLFLQSLLLTCPRHGSWTTFIRLSHDGAKSEILTLKKLY
jgi:hypothetical protein